MLKQILDLDFSVNEIMLGIGILLGVLIFIKFISTVVKNKSYRERKRGPVYKNLIKKTNEI